MLVSLPWASPRFGVHTDPTITADRFEMEGFFGLVYSSLICLAFGCVFLVIGRRATGRLFRKEAMAIVGLSWLLATFLGALPFVFSGTQRGPSVRVFDQAGDTNGHAYVVASRLRVWQSWLPISDLAEDEFKVIRALSRSSARGLSKRQLRRQTGLTDIESAFDKLSQRRELEAWLIRPGGGGRLAPADRASKYRLQWVRMGLVDAMFEAQSGFSTTGATVLSDLEDPYVVPRCILFWRASTHFLGGLGIIVLFVVILGQGSAGKALMRAEVPGPTQDNAAARMQHTAWLFTAMYVGLNVILAIILFLLGMTTFDSLCHAFATMATGGFSTYNASLGHFDSLASTNGPVIEYTIIVFMVLAGTNFTLLALCLFAQPGKLLADVEWRTYVAIIVLVTGAIFAVGMIHGDFQTSSTGIRDSLFQVVSILTTTGYGTSDFDVWNHFSRGLLFVLMFVGGCAGSTGGGMKVIRHVLFVKILSIELEHAFHPKVVRLLRIGGKPVEDETLRHSSHVYFGLITNLFVVGFLILVSLEPDSTWGPVTENKLMDSASAVSATLNNIGPGLGTVGPTCNYGHFSALSKMLFVFLMMLGRLEIFPILVLLVPRFWRDQ